MAKVLRVRSRVVSIRDMASFVWLWFTSNMKLAAWKVRSSLYRCSPRVWPQPPVPPPEVPSLTGGRKLGSRKSIKGGSASKRHASMGRVSFSAPEKGQPEEGQEGQEDLEEEQGRGLHAAQHDGVGHIATQQGLVNGAASGLGVDAERRSGKGADGVA